MHKIGLERKMLYEPIQAIADILNTRTNAFLSCTEIPEGFSEYNEIKKYFSKILIDRKTLKYVDSHEFYEKFDVIWNLISDLNPDKDNWVTTPADNEARNEQLAMVIYGMIVKDYIINEYAVGMCKTSVLNTPEAFGPSKHLIGKNIKSVSVNDGMVDIIAWPITFKYQNFGETCLITDIKASVTDYDTDHAIIEICEKLIDCNFELQSVYFFGRVDEKYKSDIELFKEKGLNLNLIEK